MARKLKEGTPVAWLPADHPAAKDGAGYYEVVQDNEHESEFDDDGNSLNTRMTNTDVEYGLKVEWVKNKADPEGEPNNPENNEGHFVYPSKGDEE